MTDEQLNAYFRTIADHLESLATSIQSVEELREQDRARQEEHRLRQEVDRLRIDRLERLFKLMLRLGIRERKELRERINALIDAQMRSDAKMESLNEKMQELSAAQKQSVEASALFQAQVGHILSKLADATELAHRRLDAIESNGQA